MSNRAEVARLYRAVGRHNLVVGAAGNVSARANHTMLITATGAAPDHITPRQVVPTDFAGCHQGRLLPSSEWQMHAVIYQAAPEAQYIVHTHSDAVVALASFGEPLPAFHYAVAEFGGPDVRCAPYALFGSPALAHLAAEAIAGRTACLLANHGMICHGATPQAALLAALRLETLARQYLLARSAGTPHLLDATQMQAALARYATYGQQKDTPP